MKYRKHATLLAISATLLANATISQAQLGGDPTTPPTGAPTRTMKTLDQVEARIPLVEGAPGVAFEPVTGTITISQSGSYYMVENLSLSDGDGIIITANNVTLDLNGFTIEKNTIGGSGIRNYDLLSNITIKNGIISSPFESDGSTVTSLGFSEGVNVAGRNITISNLTISGTGDGIAPNYYNSPQLDVVESCSVTYVSGFGIVARTIRNSSATFCREVALLGTDIENSYGHSLNSIGIRADKFTSIASPDLGKVVNSSGSSNGIDAGDHGIMGAIIVNSQGFAEAGFGIASSKGSVSYSVGVSESNIGIEATSSTVSYSRGKSNSGSVGIIGAIVIGSTVPLNNTVTSSEKHLGTP